MKKVIGFATGNIYRWAKTDNIAGLIKYIQELDIDGAELTLATKEELYDSRLNPSQLKWLKSLNYVSIHAPFRLVSRTDNKQEIIKQLDYIQNLYKKISAKNMIIHPNELPTPDVLNKYSMKFSTENLTKNKHIDIKQLEQIINKYENIGFCLDVAHAYTWSKNETGKIMKKFKNKITEIHFSGTYKKKAHQSLRIVTKEFMKSIESIKELNVPIVIEEDILTKDIRYIKEEIEYIKSLF